MPRLKKWVGVFWAVAALSPGAMAAPPRPGLVYPMQSAQVPKADLAELDSLLHGALARSVKYGLFTDAAPTLAASCGAKPALACLAGLAKGGLVLVAEVGQRGNYFLLTLHAIDGRGAVRGPVQASVDTVARTQPDLDKALQRLAAPSAPPAAVPAPPVAAAPASAAPAVLPDPAAAAPGPAPAARVSAPAAALSARATPQPLVEGAWLRPAALWTGVAAVAALGGGITAGLLAKKTSDDLTARSASNSLTPADAGSYHAVGRYDLVANLLFATASVAAVTALVFLALAPDGDDPERSR